MVTLWQRRLMTAQKKSPNVNAVLKANYWKLIADGTEPVMPEKNGIMCTEQEVRRLYTTE
jgi:hypothetical protein